MIFYRDIWSPTFEMHVDLNVLPLVHRRHPHFLNKCFKSIHVISYSLSDVPIVRKCNRRTRATDQNLMAVPRLANNSGRRALAYRGPTTWNKVPLQFRQIERLDVYKCEYFTYVSANFRQDENHDILLLFHCRLFD